MNKPNKPSLPRLLKLLLDIISGLLALVLAGLLILMVASPFLASRELALGSVSVPVRLGSGGEHRLEVSFPGGSPASIGQAYLEDTRGMLRVETSKPLLLEITYGSRLLLGAGVLYITLILRKILALILQGEPFSAENARAIRRLGYAVLIVGFASGLLPGLAAWGVLALLPASSPALQASPVFDARLVLGASLFIFLLAQIWGYGLELERDRALTV